MPSLRNWKCIQTSDTQTVPYSNMKQELRTPVRSTIAPNMIGNTGFDCWGRFQSLVNTSKIVIHEMKRNRSFKVFDLL